MNNPRSLRRLHIFPNRPASDLIFTGSKEIYEIESMITSFDYFGDHCPFVLVFAGEMLVLEMCREWDYLTRDIAVYVVFDFL
jgi:hypothetical protein